MRQINFLNRIVILSIVFLFLVVSAQAATFTINSTLDDGDLTPGNGLCATALGSCTLRAAIEEVNFTSTTNTFNFAIAGAGVKTFIPASAYPSIVGTTVTIDGWTQGGAGYTGSPLIEINGTNAGAGANGLRLGSGHTIRGLAINRFSGNGIQLEQNGNTIQGCYIGTDATGNLDLGNTLNGINVISANNTIGGSLIRFRNVISGNNTSGITLQQGSNDFFPNGNVIIGNYIGTTASGAAAIPNGEHGIYLKGFGVTLNTIGGTTAGERNVISGNTQYGINLDSINGFFLPVDNIVTGNYIGTDASGTADLGNGSGGINIASGSSGNQIGGTTAGERNVISGNGVAGSYGGIVIRGAATTSNVITGTCNKAASTITLGKPSRNEVKIKISLMDKYLGISF